VAPHTCDSWGIDFSLVRYFTILGFSDGRIVAIHNNIAKELAVIRRC
jgi:hypothetical protein